MLPNCNPALGEIQKLPIGATSLCKHDRADSPLFEVFEIDHFASRRIEDSRSQVAAGRGFNHAGWSSFSGTQPREDLVAEGQKDKSRRQRNNKRKKTVSGPHRYACQKRSQRHQDRGGEHVQKRLEHTSFDYLEGRLPTLRIYTAPLRKQTQAEEKEEKKNKEKEEKHRQAQDILHGAIILPSAPW